MYAEDKKARNQVVLERAKVSNTEYSIPAHN